MEIHIDNLLKEQNKTRYWLSKETGITYANIVKICKSETNSVTFDTMEKLCNALNCKLDDIFVIK